jgi:Ca2+-binding EF-hand superfamily protein
VLGGQDKHIDQIIKEVDVNGDGEISFEEFSEMMKKLTEA